MPYPAGVVTRALSFSQGVDTETGTEAVVTRAVVTCNNLLFHIATGVPLLPDPIITGGNLVLPVTDQNGAWVDSKGTALTSPTHTYRLELERQVVNNGPWIGYKVIEKLVVPTAGGVTDMDLYVLTNTNYSSLL